MPRQHQISTLYRTESKKHAPNRLCMIVYNWTNCWQINVELISNWYIILLIYNNSIKSIITNTIQRIYLYKHIVNTMTIDWYTAQILYNTFLYTHIPIYVLSYIKSYRLFSISFPDIVASHIYPCLPYRSIHIIFILMCYILGLIIRCFIPHIFT